MVTRLVKGTAVVDIADGTKLGVVDAVYLDPERKEIAAFSFHRGGRFGGRTSGLMEIGDVRGIGPDAVTVCGGPVYSEVAVRAKGEQLVDLEALLQRPVVTEGGAALGRVAAIHFAQESHALVALEVEAEGSDGPIVVDAGRIATIGAELVIVTESGAPPCRESRAASPVQLLDATRGAGAVAQAG